MPPAKKSRRTSSQGRTKHSTRKSTTRGARSSRSATGRGRTRSPAAKGGRKRSPGRGSSAYGERARGFLPEEIRHHRKDKGMGQDQAVASAMGEARRKGQRVPSRRSSASR